MPDDDYEKVTVGCGCAQCSPINTKMEKDKQINALLSIMEYDFNTKFHPDVRNAFWYIHKIIKVLRLMNGIG
jgi:hypothetical protein